MNLERVPPDLRPLVERFLLDVDGLTDQLVLQGIAPDSWEASMSRLIARYHIAAMVQGMQTAVITPSVGDYLERLIDVQLGFLAGFTAVVSSAPSLPQVMNKIAARARLYTLAIKTAWHMGDIIKQVGRPLPLPAMPCQGTQCGNNCGCGWVIKTINEEAGDYDAFWTRHKDDSCQTCLQRELEWNGPNGDGSQPVRVRSMVLMI